MRNKYRNAYTGWLTALWLVLPGSAAMAQPEYPDVAPIFYNRCTSCHHPGGAGPFPLMQYSETVAKATDIFIALNDGYMPPWSPDTTYTRFLHERIITDAEKNLIYDWLSASTPQGDTTLVTPPVYTQYQLYGTPDMELQIPTFTSNAGSTDSYVCFSLPTNLPQDRFLRAFEIVPGNGSIVHHVLVNADTLGTTTNNLSGTCYTVPGDFGIGGFAPGAPPTVFPGQAPLKLGIRLKAGTRIVLQMHYPAGSAGQQDSTKIRLYFYPLNETGIRPVTVSTPLQNWSLFLPPNLVNVYTAQFPPLPLDLSLLAAFPHSHLICTSIVNFADLAGDTIPLIRINDWDFEWQGYYSYRYPVRLPAGYTLRASHNYDNTSANPNNPNNPPQLVLAGFSTTDEMLFDSYQFTYYLPGDENIDIGALLETDSLLSGIPPAPGYPQTAVQVYPNPSRNDITFTVHMPSGTEQEVRVFDLSGKQVAVLPLFELQPGISQAKWNLHGGGNRVPAGVYVYSVKSGTKTESGKLILLPE